MFLIHSTVFLNKYAAAARCQVLFWVPGCGDRAALQKSVHAVMSGQGKSVSAEQRDRLAAGWSRERGRDVGSPFFLG